MKFNEDKRLRLLARVIEDRLGVDLKNNSRHISFVYARALFYSLAYSTKSYSYSSIGKYVGRDHATVLHGINNVLPQALKIETYRKIYDELRVFIKDEDNNLLRTHEDGIVNLYTEIRKQNKIIEELSLQVVRMKIKNSIVDEAFKDLTPDESEELLDKMNLHSKVIRNQRNMNERSSQKRVDDPVLGVRSRL